jgi:hypothetical protein
LVSGPYPDSIRRLLKVTGNDGTGGGSMTGIDVHGTMRAAEPPAWPRLDVAELRHPSEQSRFALALVASALAVAVGLFVLVSLGELTLLLALVVAMGIVVLLFWVGLQIWRVRLLGDAVLVSARTLPDVQEIVDVVRARLAYDRRIDLYVVDKISRVLSVDSAPITLTSFFGVHVLVAEGDALGDLDDAMDRRRLVFTLATYVGALKARYAQWWSPLFLVLYMTRLTVFVTPLIWPWYRATIYSGDRIAYACCGDLDVSLDVVYRALVGKDMAARLRADGLTGQALAVRRRWIPRIAQLMRSTPHATNRYLDLLAFIRRTEPEVFDARRTAFGGGSLEADRVLATLAGKRARRGTAVSIGVVLAAALLAGGAVGGLQFRDSPVAHWMADFYAAFTSGGASSEPDAAGEGGITPAEPAGPSAGSPGSGSAASSHTSGEPGGRSPGAPESSGSAASSQAGPLQTLRARVPPAMRPTCAIGQPDPAVGLRAVLICRPADPAPVSLMLYAYEDETTVTTSFDAIVGALPTGPCPGPGDGRTVWDVAGVTQGPLACFDSAAGGPTVAWAATASGTLAVASDPAWTIGELIDWWWTAAPDLA